MFALAGCDKADEEINAAVDKYIFGGFYESRGLEIEVEGTSAHITAIDPEHDLGKDPSILMVGDLYLKNIKETGDKTWEADIFKYDYNIVSHTGTPKGWEKTTITVGTNDEVIFSNSNRYDYSFKKKTASGGGGSGGGNGNGNIEGDTVFKQKYNGDMYEEITVTYTPTPGTKSVTFLATEFNDIADRNTADMFVRKGAKPIINNDKISKYSWTADHAGINPNRADEIYTVNNPSGTYYITLYGYDTYFLSWLVIVEKK